jgi:hypothetical protein
MKFRRHATIAGRSFMLQQTDLVAWPTCPVEGFG